MALRDNSQDSLGDNKGSKIGCSPVLHKTSVFGEQTISDILRYILYTRDIYIYINESGV